MMFEGLSYMYEKSADVRNGTRITAETPVLFRGLCLVSKEIYRFREMGIYPFRSSSPR